MSNRLTVPTAVGLAVVTLIIGAAIGSLAFPIARTTTATLVTTKTTTNHILSTVTITHTTNTSFGTTSSSETTSTSTISTTTNTTLVSTTPTTDVIFPQGTSFQVQSSYDCLAGHDERSFNVTAVSNLEGAINASHPGVTIYISTAQDAQSVTQGHPSSWIYSSELTSSTSFNVSLQPGSYVLWIEGADLACGATIVTPLEELTTVTVIQSIVLAATTT